MNQLELGAFTELNEQEMYDTEGGFWQAVFVGIGLVAVLGGGMYVMGKQVNNERRNTAQTNANMSQEPCTVKLLGPNAPTYTAYPDPNYTGPTYAKSAW